MPARVVIHHLFVSPGHNFFGRHGMPAGDHPTHEATVVRCKAGWGIEGDRFFGRRPDYKGQVTFFSWETFEAVKQELAVPQLSAAAFRRNIVIEGVDLNTLVGVRFSIGGVEFGGTEESRPCYWMNAAVAPGAEDWLRGRGGLRARVLTDGELSRGAHTLALTGGQEIMPGFVERSLVH